MSLIAAASVTSLVSGLFLSGSLIVAIGAQNTFVLRQGLRREHVVVVVSVCTLIDILLMTLGVSGLGRAVTEHPRVLNAAALGGAVMLGWYGLSAFRRALHPEALVVQAAGGLQSTQRVVGQVLTISLLNPHVYLDTVVLVGTVGARQVAGTQWAFLLGAGLASTVWFTSLGFGARALSPLFARQRAWQVLDVLVGLTMCGTAIRLAQGVLVD